MFIFDSKINQLYANMKQLRNLLSFFLFCVLTISLASCGNDDLGGNCEICSYTTLNSKCTVSGLSFHSGTSMAQFLSSKRGSYLNIHMHKDGGDVLDFHNIDLTISAITGPSIDDIQVGQSLQFADGTDGIMYFYDTGGVSIHHEQVTFDRYISGTVTCTKKNGTESVLTFKNVVLQNRKDDTKVTIDGTFVCDEFRH